MAIAIMCSGGDAAGMNPAIKKFVDYVFKIGQEPYFIYDGLEGMIEGKIERATHEDVAGIVHLGGTILRSSRSKRFFEFEFRKKAFENLEKHNIDSLVVLGGDGSFRAMHQFYKDFSVPFVGIPATIDNDINATQYCLGVDTALNVIRDALDKIRDTASSFNRAFLVEVMGRDCGYLALMSAITSGAEICVIPEMEFKKQEHTARLRHEIKEGRRYILAVVSEGTKRSREVFDWLQDDVGIETRISILGHIQRGGNPTVQDRMMAYEFVITALNHLSVKKESAVMVGYKDGDFKLVDIEEVVSKPYEIPQKLLDDIKYLD